MRTKLLFLLVVFLVVCIDCFSYFNAQAQDASGIDAVIKAISETAPEGKAIIEKVKHMKPELNYQRATRTLSQIVEDYAVNKGAYNITIIGWEADQKKPVPGKEICRWKVVLHYRTGRSI